MQTEWQTVQILNRSWSALFAQAYLSEHLGSLRRNFLKFSDRQVWADSADPDQTDQGLHCLPFRLHRLDSLL